MSEAVLTELLHRRHPGCTRMKGLSRMYLWWQGIAKDIESTVRNCTACQVHQSSPPVAPLHPWSWPICPWARLHPDYTDPFEGKMILILINAHSMWVEAICMTGSTSAVVIDEFSRKEKKKITQGSMKSRLLFPYRVTLQTTIGASPSKLLLGPRPRSRLDLLKPHTADRVEKKQLQPKEQHDSRSRERDVRRWGRPFLYKIIKEIAGCPV